MDHKKIKIGVIGTGAIAAIHIKCIKEIDQGELIAVASSSKERAALASKTFNIPAYASFEEMMNNETLDLVCICTASGQHLPPTIAAAQRGIHVLTEKPLEVNLERADEMIGVCQKHDVKLGCIFQNRFKPGYQQLKKAVEQGQLGRLIAGNAYIKWFRDPNYYHSSPWKGTIAGDGGAALINQGIHTIDLLLDIMGDANSVIGKTQTTLHDIEGEDIGMAIVTFQNGALGTIQGSTAMYPGYPERLEIFGTKGSAILENGLIKEWHVVDHIQDTHESEELPVSAADPMAIGHQFHKWQISDMINAILDHREPSINGIAARKALALIMAIYRSNTLKSEVKVF